MKNPFKRPKIEDTQPTVASGPATKSDGQIRSSDLPITLYLNQRLIFDLLAALEDGFSHLTGVQTTTSDGTSSELSGEGKLGIGNDFALVGVNFGGRGARKSERSHSEQTTAQIVHTPTSLFARLRKELFELDMVQEVAGAADLPQVSHGDFVEFPATLRRNPLDEMFSMLSRIAPLIDLADQPDQPEQARNRGANKRRPNNQRKKNDSSVKNQIESAYGVFNNDNSQDFVAELDNMNVVLTADKTYFNDPTMNDAIDGQFRVFGKVTRVIPANSEANINLLRRSPIGRFASQVPDSQNPFSEFEKLGFGPMQSEVQGPAMQVIPIAIFS